MFIFKNRNLNILFIFICILGFACKTDNSTAKLQSGWDSVSSILNQIEQPKFADKEFSVTDFGAIGDGTTLCTNAINEAIRSCNKAGGGKVLVADGKYLTGAIVLLSNVELNISENATLLFVQDPNHYLPMVFSRWEGVECMNYSPFIYAFEQENIAITGQGTLNGQADSDFWWPWKGRENYGWRPGQPFQKEARDRLFKMAEEGVPVSDRTFGEGSFLRLNFIQPYRCKNILIEGIKIINSPMWEIHPVLCENVTVRGVKIVSHGPNNDGCNPESCINVLIEDCYFDTGDDCIAIKSGRNADGRRINVPSENIIVRNCQMKDGHGGIVIGSEISGGANNIFVEDCEMDSPNLERALRIKTNSIRGGLIENIFMRNVTIGEVEEAVLRVNFYYEEGDAGNYPPVVQNIHLENVNSEKSRYVFFLKGYSHSNIRDIFVSNCSFRGVSTAGEISQVHNLVLDNVEISNK